MERLSWWQDDGIEVDSGQADTEDDGDGQHGAPVQDPGEGVSRATHGRYYASTSHNWYIWWLSTTLDDISLFINK